MKYSRGFALPTVLIVSVILLMLLTTGISATVAVNNGLRDQYYTRLASLAADAGTAFANACFVSNKNEITWTDADPLRPNTDCNGTVNGSLSAYVLDQNDIRTYFVVGTDMQPKGYTEGVRETTDLAWRVWTTGSANAVQVPTVTLPPGTVINGTWTTAPTGFLFANGACVSTSTYSVLYGAIGNTYGTTCAAGQFKLPDLEGRNIVTRDPADTAFDTLGETGGSKTHTLTVAQIPAHNHDVGGVYPNNANSGAIYIPSAAGGSYGLYYDTATRSIGGGQAHNILDPYIVLNSAIKY